MRLWRKRVYVKRWFLSYNYGYKNQTGFGSGEVSVKYAHKRNSETITRYDQIKKVADKTKEHYGFDEVIVLYYCVMSEGYEYEKPQVETKR